MLRKEDNYNKDIGSSPQRRSGHGRPRHAVNSRNPQYHPDRIPEGWLDHPSIHQPIKNTRFLAFKTPLRPEFFELDEHKANRAQNFEVMDVIKHITALDRELGLVIDLTDTLRYYNPDLWQEHKIAYKKIRCPGHEVNGNETLYMEFLTTVKDFLGKNIENDKLIGVHCTHGLNRTGYLICRYLIEENNWTAKQAIEAFREARNCSMSRKAYIESLHEIEERTKGLKLTDVNPNQHKAQHVKIIK